MRGGAEKRVAKPEALNALGGPLGLGCNKDEINHCRSATRRSNEIRSCNELRALLQLPLVAPPFLSRRCGRRGWTHDTVLPTGIGYFKCVPSDRVPEIMPSTRRWGGFLYNL
eukprot:GHVO01026010.1.p1 GENE.GHVO01026010.1~~GHVO01026010.1.p1  ORF type:complete len:112 (+),score=5.78 GHVO01026010.1:351-686(+)